MPVITTREEFLARFPLSPIFEDKISIEGKQTFARTFVQARDEVEKVYYAQADKGLSPAARSRQFLSALFNPVIGRPVKDAEQFYETFGRLMRWAWLSVSVGIYDDSIHALADPVARLHLAQTNTIDLAWRPVFSLSPPEGLIVEVGTGRGNSIARLSQLFPQARIVSITVSPEQAQIAQMVARELHLDNVEVRLGNIFDPAVTEDLIGQADGVTAIEVTGNFPHDLKNKGISIFASLLKPGAPLSLLDSAMSRPLSPYMQRYYTNQSWYFGSREGYFSAFEQAGVTPVAYLDYSQAVLPTFTDTTIILRGRRADLRRDFGAAMALIWPEVPGSIYLQTVKRIEYIHITGIKNSAT